MSSDAHRGTVTATSPLTIRPIGSSVDVPAMKLASYTPAVNDRVAYVRFDGAVLVLGKVG